MTSFEWPSQYYFPPFFTIQPNQETRQRQFEIWSSLILNYCKTNKIFILDKTANDIPLFNNPDISRRLSVSAVETILKDMASKGQIEWFDSKEERCFVLWHSLAEWGDILYAWANDNGLANSVATFYELVNPDNPNEFPGMDYALLTRIVQSLQSRGKAEMIETEGITGGSSGIGKALAIAVVERGANVSIVSRSVPKLQEAVDEIRKHAKRSDQEINYFSADVNKYEDMEQAVSNAEKKAGPVDILIASAGYSYPARFEDIPLSHFEDMMNINYLGVVKTTKAVVKTMKARKKGKIVIISSAAGLWALYGFTGYSPTKFALRGFAEALQMEVKPFNISVTVGFPADTETPCFEEENKTKPMETKLMSETAGVFQPSEVANGILKSVMVGDFYATVGFDSFNLGVLCSTTTPPASLFMLLLDLIYTPILRLVCLGYLWSFNRIVAKCAEEKEKQKRKE